MVSLFLTQTVTVSAVRYLETGSFDCDDATLEIFVCADIGHHSLSPDSTWHFHIIWIHLSHKYYKQAINCIKICRIKMLKNDRLLTVEVLNGRMCSRLIVVRDHRFTCQEAWYLVLADPHFGVLSLFIALNNLGIAIGKVRLRKYKNFNIIKYNNY